MKFMPVVIGVLLAWVMVICTQTALAEDVIERTVAISDVTQLQIEGDGSVVLRIGDAPQLKMTAAESQLDKIKVDAKGNTLRIRKNNRWGWFSENSNIAYEVTLTQLQWLEVSGGMSVDVLSAVTADNFELKVNGGSTINFAELAVKNKVHFKLNGGCEFKVAHLTAKELDVKGNGASDITVMAGSVQKQTLKFNGASDYKAYALESDVADVHNSGASDVKLWVKEKLDLHLNGAGAVYYYGNPEVSSKISGVSDVVRQGDVPPK